MSPPEGPRSAFPAPAGERGLRPRRLRALGGASSGRPPVHDVRSAIVEHAQPIMSELSSKVTNPGREGVVAVDVPDSQAMDGFGLLFGADAGRTLRRRARPRR